MREVHVQVFTEVGLQVVPVTLVVADLPAPGADRQQAAQRLDGGQRLLQLLDQRLALGLDPLAFLDLGAQLPVGGRQFGRALAHLLLQLVAGALERLFGLLAPRNVQADADHALRPAGGVVVEPPLGLDPADGIFRQGDAVFDLVVLTLAEDFGHRPFDVIPVLRVDFLEEGFHGRPQGPGGAAVDRFQLGGPGDGAGADVPVPRPDLGGLQDELVWGLVEVMGLGGGPAAGGRRLAHGAPRDRRHARRTKEFTQEVHHDATLGVPGAGRVSPPFAEEFGRPRYARRARRVARKVHRSVGQALHVERPRRQSLRGDARGLEIAGRSGPDAWLPPPVGEARCRTTTTEGTPPSLTRSRFVGHRPPAEREFFRSGLTPRPARAARPPRPHAGRRPGRPPG